MQLAYNYIKIITFYRKNLIFIRDRKCINIDIDSHYQAVSDMILYIKENNIYNIYLYTSSYTGMDNKLISIIGSRIIYSSILVFKRPGYNITWQDLNNSIINTPDETINYLKNTL